MKQQGQQPERQEKNSCHLDKLSSEDRQAIRDFFKPIETGQVRVRSRTFPKKEEVAKFYFENQEFNAATDYRTPLKSSQKSKVMRMWRIFLMITLGTCTIACYAYGLVQGAPLWFAISTCSTALMAVMIKIISLNIKKADQGYDKLRLDSLKVRYLSKDALYVYHLTSYMLWSTILGSIIAPISLMCMGLGWLGFIGGPLLMAATLSIVYLEIVRPNLPTTK